MAHPDKHPNADPVTARRYHELMTQLNAAKNSPNSMKEVARIQQELFKMQATGKNESRMLKNLIETAERIAREIVAEAKGGVPWSVRV